MNHTINKFYLLQIYLFICISIICQSTLTIAGTIELPETGQTTCYDEEGNVVLCKDTGQNGDAQAGVAWPSPRFTDIGNGTVTDNLTGLMWARDANISFTTWQGAFDYVKGMNDGSYYNLGYTDWRLPNVNELESLVNLDEVNQSTWLNGQGFTFVQSNIYWTSSSRADRTYYAWNVSMSNGSVGSSNKSGINGYVWPVR